MKQTFTKDSIVQTSDTHIHLLNAKGDSVYSTNSDAVKHGVVLLPRKAFVKPVDVEALAHINSEKYYFKSVPKEVVFKSFMEGYASAPKKEFTREDMVEAVKYGAAYALSRKISSGQQLENDASEFVDSLQPLSIPEQITIENNQVIEVIW